MKDFAAIAVALFGVIVTGGLGLWGVRSFDRWKREKIEEKRIDLAIEALAIGFKAHVVFDDIRSRFAQKSYGDVVRVEAEDVISTAYHHRQQDYNEVLRRVEAKQPFFDEVLTIEPKFIALFGRDKEAIFKRLFRARHLIINAIDVLSELNGADPDATEAREERVKLRKRIFASSGTLDPEDTLGPKDEVGKLLQEFRDEIEKLCGPIVDRSFKQ